MCISDEEKARARRRRSATRTSTRISSRCARWCATQPDNIELKKALVSGIASAEFAGIDAFSRKVVEWQEWPVPQTLIMAMARQTWDEVRHAMARQGPDRVVRRRDRRLPGHARRRRAASRRRAARARCTQGFGAQAVEQLLRDPVVSLSMTNVSLEGGALTLFQETSAVAREDRRQADGALLRLQLGRRSDAHGDRRLLREGS